MRSEREYRMRAASPSLPRIAPIEVTRPSRCKRRQELEIAASLPSQDSASGRASVPREPVPDPRKLKDAVERFGAQRVLGEVSGSGDDGIGRGFHFGGYR